MNKKNIVLIGAPGCGKTTIGRKLAENLKIEFCDVDEYIEKMKNESISSIFKKGEAYFRQIENEAIKEVSNTCPKVIATGGGVVKNPGNINFLKKNGIIIFINRPIENIVHDIKTDSRPLLKGGIDILYKLHEERYPLYKKYCDYELLNNTSIEDILKEFEKLLLMMSPIILK